MLTGSLSHFSRRHRPLPKSCASYFRFARFNTFPPYYLRAWHRLQILQLSLRRVSDIMFTRTSLDFFVSMPGKAPFQARVIVTVRSNLRFSRREMKSILHFRKISQARLIRGHSVISQALLASDLFFFSCLPLLPFPVRPPPLFFCFSR